MTSTDLAIIPFTRQRKKVYVPQRFVKEIKLHVFKNRYAENFAFATHTPLILAIQGRPGMGKTRAVEYTCDSEGYALVYISGADISGSYEKEAVMQIDKAYKQASAIQQTTGKPVVLLIDDIDRSVAAATQMQHTINTQLVNGFLMNLCDKPTGTTHAPRQRVPIIITANNLQHLDSALMRPGRMRFLNYTLLETEMICVLNVYLSNLFPKLNIVATRDWIQQFPQEPVSFFTSTVDRLVDALLLDLLEQYPQLDKLTAEQIHCFITNKMHTVTIEAFIKHSRQLQQSQQAINYLEAL